MLTALASTLGAPALPPTMNPTEVREVRTDDGWSLELRHYPGEGPAVLLVHGMWANHHNWDYRPENSLADALNDAGWDVWVPALRGDPGTVAPDPWAETHFTFDDHVERDLPALVATVREQTDGEPVYWVGHSMGGMLLYAYLRDHPEDVAAGVTVSSPASFSEPSPKYRRAARARALLVGRRVRATWFASALRLAGPHGAFFESFQGEDNLSWPMAKGLSEHAFVDLPRTFVVGATEWIRAGEVLDDSGRPWFHPSEVPLLVLAGAGDRAVRPSDVEAATALFPNSTYELVGHSTGYAKDYGHVDILLGTTSRADVYPRILGFLDQASGRASCTNEPAGAVSARVAQP